MVLKSCLDFWKLSKLQKNVSIAVIIVKVDSLALIEGLFSSSGDSVCCYVIIQRNI